MNNKEYTTLGVYDYIILGMGIDILLFYYSFYSFIAIGRIAAIARFNFIRSNSNWFMRTMLPCDWTDSSDSKISFYSL